MIINQNEWKRGNNCVFKDPGDLILEHRGTASVIQKTCGESPPMIFLLGGRAELIIGNALL